MIRQLLSVFRRPARSARYMAVAAVALVVVEIVASALTPAARRGHVARRTPASAIASQQTGVTAQRIRPSASAVELARARGIATRFLERYLPFVYGRASAKSVRGVTPALRRELTRETAQVTPAEHGRHPRVASLAVVGQAPRVVLATALVEDGGVTAYALRITLQEGSSGWLASAVDGG